MIPGLDEVVSRLLYQFLYNLGLTVWNINRIILAIASFIQNIEEGLIDSVTVFVEYMTNALGVPTAMFLLLAITSLGTWYLLNNVLPTQKWVDPSKLLLYGLLTGLFFVAPASYIDSLEGLRTAVVSAIDFTIVDDGVADIFDVPTIGTGSGYDDVPMPAAIPDLNADGAIATFDFVGYFLSIQNENEISRSTFPDTFADTYFPDTPTEIDLSSEGARNAAIESANQGIIILFLSFFAIPAAIAEHTLWLALTLAALLLYVGMPIAMMFSFFIFTESLFANYVRQFIKLMIETFLSTLFAAFAIGLVSVAAQVGAAIYIAACLVATCIFIWRIIGAMKLASNAFDLFGGGTLTGGATAQDARKVVTGSVTTGLAMGGAGLALGGAGVLLADKKAGGVTGDKDSGVIFDANKTDNRVKQLQALAGYSAGKNKTARQAIESTHEAKTFGKNFLNGGAVKEEPAMLDFLRAGSSMSSFGSSPWMAMRMSPPLRRAMDMVGGKTNGMYYDEQAPVGNGVSPMMQLNANLSRLIETLSPSGQAARQAGQSGVQDVNLISRNPDADGDGTDDDLERQPLPTNRAESSAATTTVSKGRLQQATTQDYAFASPTAPVSPSIAITSNQGGEGHQTAVSQTIQALGQEGGAQQTAAYTQIANAVGPETANEVQTAVQEAGSGEVTLAAQTSITVAGEMASEGKDGQEILTAFQTGEGIERVQAELGEESNLSQNQLHAITDLSLQPTREVSPQELGAALGTAVEAGGNEQDVAAALGSQIPNMQSMTGEIRGVIQQAGRMNLSAADMRQISAQLEQNLVAQVQQTLSSKPGTAGEKAQFISNMNNLQNANISIIQTTNPGGQEDA